VLERGEKHNLLWSKKMICPYCQNPDTRVVDKRDNGGQTKRRRECEKCERRFNTFENVERPQLRVIKKDGSREDFDPEKLKRGMVRACEKRPVSTEVIDKMTFNVEERLRKMGKKDINTSYIGELVSKELKKVDKVAYIRFASVYREFEDISDFKKEIKGL
jgi:transcriptional repressor NrdR